MKIILVNKSDANDTMEIGDTSEGIIIPRVGEKVNRWYSPAPKVTDVAYDYFHNVVIIILDGMVNRY